MAINLFQEAKKLKKDNREALKMKQSQYITNQGGHYVPLSDLVNQCLNNKEILEGINTIKSRLGDRRYQARHFGRVGMVKLGKILINIDIQRGILAAHVGETIMGNFDPRITQPVNLIYYADTDTYTCWDGLQTSSTLMFLIAHAMIECDNWQDFEVKANIIDADLEVPGAFVQGAEAVANFGFRTLNGKGRCGMEPYYLMRSQCHGKKLYQSELVEDVHSYEMWETLAKHQMFPASHDDRKKPGHISHISGMKKMAGHGTEKFDIKSFDKSIEFLSKNFINDTGINASFYMAIAYLYKLLDEQKIELGTKRGEFNQDRFAEFIKDTYGKINTSHRFRDIAGDRLFEERKKLGYKTKTWTDDCSLPYMIDDYRKYCAANGLTTGKLPKVAKLSEFTKVAIDVEETDEE